MQQMLAVGLGGFFGAMTRHGVNLLMQKKFPEAACWATFAVNMAGCLLIGFAMALVLDRRWNAPLGQPLLVTGFLGSLTTFSTFGFQTLALMQEQQWRDAFANVALSLVVGLGAVWLGMRLARFV